MLSYKNPLSCALALAAILMLPVSAPGQGLTGHAEGSRPGQTYVQGQQAPAAAQTQSAPAPQQAAAPSSQNGRRSAAPAAQAGKPVILEFSDLQCPDSARYNMSLKSTIMQRYVSNGKADYQWHDFPLPVHDKAIEAASAARCAGPAASQVRHQIMAHQGEMSPAMYAQFAREAGANMNEYNQCVRSGQSQQAVLADKQLGQSYGVRGTPTLVLGVTDAQGRVQPVQVVKAYDPPQQVLSQIDAFLAKVGQQARQ